MIGIMGLTATLGAGPPTEPPGSSGDHAVIPLGKAFDTDGREVEGLAIIHFKKGFGKGGNNPNKGGGKNGGSDCFAFTAKGARWKTTESYVVDPSNGAGLNHAAVVALTSTGLNTWDTEVAFNIFGTGTSGTGVNSPVTRDLDSPYGGADGIAPDGQNEVMFGNLGSNTIGVTVVWGRFGGPPFGRELREWDTVFNDDDFDWSTSGEAGKMDYENIAAHEFGHSAGMGHPDGSCTEETMYSFASNGETKKRGLNPGDIAGINELY